MRFYNKVLQRMALVTMNPFTIPKMWRTGILIYDKVMASFRNLIRLRSISQTTDRKLISLKYIFP
jgi:hypothetical protein